MASRNLFSGIWVRVGLRGGDSLHIIAAWTRCQLVQVAHLSCTSVARACTPQSHFGCTCMRTSVTLRLHMQCTSVGHRWHLHRQALRLMTNHIELMHLCHGEPGVHAWHSQSCVNFVTHLSAGVGVDVTSLKGVRERTNKWTDAEGNNHVLRHHGRHPPRRAWA